MSVRGPGRAVVLEVVVELARELVGRRVWEEVEPRVRRADGMRSGGPGKEGAKGRDGGWESVQWEGGEVLQGRAEGGVVLQDAPHDVGAIHEFQFLVPIPVLDAKTG